MPLGQEVIADGPNGPLVLRNGQWVPLNSATNGPTTIITKPADPRRAQIKDAPTGFRWRADGTLEPIPGGPARDDGNKPPAGYRWKKDGGLEFIPGGPADPKNQPVKYKALREGDGNKLNDNVTTYSDFKRLTGSFKDDYGGNPFGGLENTAQSYLGGVGTPGQAQWWADFRATDNVIRNRLYGASLTAGEKEAYDQTTISPGMAPSQIRANLARREQIVRAVIARQVARFKAGGYNPEEVDALTGEYGPDFAPKPADAPATPAVPASKDQAVPIGGFTGNEGSVNLSTDPETLARPGPSEGADDLTVTDKPKPRYVSSDKDRTYAAALQSAFNKKASPAELDAISEKYGYPPVSGSPYFAGWISKRDKRGIYDPVAIPKTQLLEPTDYQKRVAPTAASPFGATTIAAADAVTGGYLDDLAGGDTRKAMNALRKEQPTASLIGDIGGSALAAGAFEGSATRLGLGRFAPIAGDAAYGAFSGSGNADGTLEDRLKGAAFGTVASTLGGVAGRRTVGAIGAGFRGAAAPAARFLADRGVPLTFGQAVGNSGLVGRVVKGAEDRISGVPVIGDLVNARRREGVNAFNAAAFDEAGAPIGFSTGGVVGPEGVELGQNATSNAYRSAVGNVNLRADPPFVADMGGAVAAGRALPQPMRGFADYTLRTRVGNSFANNGTLSGEGLQQSLRGLRADRSRLISEPYGNDFGDVTGRAEDSLISLANRQAPQLPGDLAGANASYRNYGIIRDAVDASRNGAGTGENYLFSPSMLSNKAASNARRFGRTQGTTNVPFQALTDAGQAVLPSRVPDSGTAGRLAMLALPGTLGGLGAGGGYLNETTGSGVGTGLTVGTLLALGGTRRGQQILVRAALNRPQWATNLGTNILGRRPIGGAIGAAAVPVLIGGGGQ